MTTSRPADAARPPPLTPPVARSDRPWGSFEQFAHNEAVTVKIITVSPNQRLSLQRHTQRDEFWQVIDGPADIEVGGEATSASAGERAWIPRGCTHRLGNSGTATVRILEIAFGHFDEEDIERLDDDYDRVGDPAQVAVAGGIPA